MKNISQDGLTPAQDADVIAGALANIVPLIDGTIRDAFNRAAN
jgi:hypothetical protein